MALTPRSVTAAALAAASLSCGGSPTEVVLIADTDYAVPGELDSFTLSVLGPDGTAKGSSAALASALELPRTLGVVREDGPLGPFVATLEGRLGGTVVATRVARFTMVEGEIRALRMSLLRSCAGTSCAAEQTCGETGCRTIDVGADELPPWQGPPMRLDGGPDTCVPASESCNGADDDCDGAVDEGYALETDPANCGSCGRMCDFQHGSGTCAAGECAVSSCDSGFDDCDGDGANGCETELGTSAAHCGACGTRCSPPNRQCCAGTCARSC